jgi:hypothetical protein
MRALILSADLRCNLDAAQVQIKDAQDRAAGR